MMRGRRGTGARMYTPHLSVSASRECKERGSSNLDNDGAGRAGRDAAWLQTQIGGRRWDGRRRRRRMRRSRWQGRGGGGREEANALGADLLCLAVTLAFALFLMQSEALLPEPAPRDAVPAVAAAVVHLELAGHARRHVRCEGALPTRAARRHRRHLLLAAEEIPAMLGSELSGAHGDDVPSRRPVRRQRRARRRRARRGGAANAAECGAALGSELSVV